MEINPEDKINDLEEYIKILELRLENALVFISQLLREAEGKNGKS
jgi:hypothetical protein